MARNNQSNGAAKHQYNVDRLESFRVDATDIDHGNDYPSLHSALPVTIRFQQLGEGPSHLLLRYHLLRSTLGRPGTIT